jgi:hypothetical protein
MANPGCHKRTGGGENSSSYLHIPGVLEWRSRKNVFRSSDELQFLTLSYPDRCFCFLLATFTPAFRNVHYLTHLGPEIRVFGQWLRGGTAATGALPDLRSFNLVSRFSV